MKILFNHFKSSSIPTWINILQSLLILILIQQTFQFYFDIDSVKASGIITEGIPNQNLIYEFAGRPNLLHQTMAKLNLAHTCYTGIQLSTNHVL